MSNIGKELGAAIADASTCIYNLIKEKKIRMGLIDVVNDGNSQHLPKAKWPKFLKNDYTGFTIAQVESILADNLEECEGFEFRFGFNLEETAIIFKGIIEIAYEEGDNENFIPVVYLGSKPKVKDDEESSVDHPKGWTSDEWTTLLGQMDELEDGWLLDVTTRKPIYWGKDTSRNYTIDKKYPLCAKKGDEKTLNTIGALLDIHGGYF
jgi:hypothetical protein